MSNIRVRGTTDPVEIAAVLAILQREHELDPAHEGLAAWRRLRRAALTTRGARRSSAARQH